MSEEFNKVYFIHQNTKSEKIHGTYIPIPTDYVVSVGYMHPRDDAIYMDHNLLVELENCIPGLYWDNYEAGEKFLAKLLGKIVYNFSDKIKDTYDILKEKYTEEMV